METVFLSDNTKFLFLVVLVLALCWLCSMAAWVAHGVSKHCAQVGKDGWKKLLALHRASFSFYVTIAFTMVFFLRLVDKISQDLFVSLLITYLGAIGFIGLNDRDLTKAAEEEGKRRNNGKTAHLPKNDDGSESSSESTEE